MECLKIFDFLTRRLHSALGDKQQEVLVTLTSFKSAADKLCPNLLGGKTQSVVKHLAGVFCLFYRD